MIWEYLKNPECRDWHCCC